MVAKVRGEPDPIVLRFGGGIHSRASEDEIDPRECAEGKNFQLDIENRQYRPRDPFDLEGTAPNGAQVRGLAQLQKSDGTISTLVQAGNMVYTWDGAAFVSIATVSASAKLRGHLWQNWQLDDKILITDLALVEPVKEWDGTTFKTMPNNLTGLFLAKYCFVSNERAFFGNVISNGVATPHLLVGSKITDNETLSTTAVPSAADDPFFVLTPDLRPINGLVDAFQRITISSKGGSIYTLTGNTALDFKLTELYPRSAASSEESLAYVGNDIIYGRQGRIESVFSTERFADIQADDITVPIEPDVSKFTGWTTVYNSRLQRIYLFPEDQSEVWVFHKDMAGQGLSPWSKWTTDHAFNFEPTVAMSLYDPVDGLEYTYTGDANGNLFKLEGTRGQGDAGSIAVVTERLSSLYEAPAGSEAFEIEGFIDYRKQDAVSIVLTFEFSGTHVYNASKPITIPAVTGQPVYGGGSYYGGGSFYGTPNAGRITRQKFTVAGRSNLFQIRQRVESANFFEIHQIGLRIQAAS